MKAKLKPLFRNKRNIITLVAVLTLIVGGITVGEIVTSNPSAKTVKEEQTKETKDSVKEEKKDAEKSVLNIFNKSEKTSSNKSTKSTSKASSGSTKTSSGSSSSSSQSSGDWSWQNGQWNGSAGDNENTTGHVHNWVYKTYQSPRNSYPVKICKGCGMHYQDVGCPNCGSGAFEGGMDCEYGTWQYRECACGAIEDIGWLD